MQEWYNAWAKRHAEIFGLLTDADLRMLAAWESVFVGDGVTEAELADATQHLATADVPRFRSDHLPKLQGRIRERRFLAARQRLAAAETTAFACVLCGGSGQVIVPHPRAVRDGVWRQEWGRWYTAAVACRCRRGLAVWESCRSCERHQRMTLDAYEVRNPDWEEQFRQREHHRRAEAHAAHLARQADAAAAKDRAAKRLLAGPAIDQAVNRLKAFEPEGNGDVEPDF